MIMNKSSLFQMGVLGIVAAVVCGGCSTPVEMSTYRVKTLPEISLKSHAAIKIVAENDEVEPLAESLRKAFGDSGEYSVVDDNADYWLVVGGLQAVSDGGSLETMVVDKKETGDAIVTKTRNVSSAASGLSVVVYDTASLSPVTYLDLSSFDGDCHEGVARTAADYSESFKQNLVERVKDAFLVQDKNIQVPVPMEADAELRTLFKQGRYLDFVRRYKMLGCVDLRGLRDQLHSGASQKLQKEEVARKLGNYYLYLLIRESVVRDQPRLKKTADEHLMLLETAEVKGLTESVPTALGRIERIIVAE